MAHIVLREVRGVSLMCVATQDADGYWHWDYCPDCGAKDGHHGVGIRCG